MIDIVEGDCLSVMAGLAADSLDACVTDPPYHLTTGKKGGTGPASLNLNSPAGRARISTGFMGQTWDGGDIAFRPETWAAVFRVLKPGAYLLAFGGTRTHHRMVCAIEDAGFEIRDEIDWLYGSGFPKSLDVSKAIDKAAGVERELTRPGVIRRDGYGGDWDTGSSEQRPRYDAPATAEAAAWQGWGTALKPAKEPICVARKPLVGTVAENVLRYGTGALNIEACRVATDENLNGGAYAKVGGRTESQSLHGGTGMNVPGKTVGADFVQPTGRWPANVVHDGSDEVLACLPNAPGQIAKESSSSSSRKDQNVYGTMARGSSGREPRGDAGSAARFFYCAKASKSERGEGNTHPTVKPVALMRWLCRLVTPPGGTVLDPFAGSGTTGLAAREEGFRSLLIEAEPKHAAIIRQRLGLTEDIFA